MVDAAAAAPVATVVVLLIFISFHPVNKVHTFALLRVHFQRLSLRLLRNILRSDVEPKARNNHLPCLCKESPRRVVHRLSTIYSIICLFAAI